MERKPQITICVAVLLASLFAAQPIPAQLRPLSRPAVPAPVPAARPAVATTRPRDAEADAAKDPAEQHFPGGAALKTDPEQQRLLKRAEQCVEDGRLDLAAVLWQKVLDEAGDTLMVSKLIEPLGPSSTPLMIYTSLAQHVERTLGKLPPAALAAYRTSADAEARAILASAGETGEEEALAQVVRRFFLSSIGDDAAYKLACLALDRHDFVGASRLLSKILTSHPDPSMPKADIYARLAVAAAHMQDRQTAEQSLTRLTSASGSRPPAETIDLIAADVKASVTQGLESAGPAARDWHLLLGRPERTGYMMALPPAATSRTLSELWVREHPLTFGAAPGLAAGMAGGFGAPVMIAGGGRVIMRGAGGVMVAGGSAQPATVATSREELITQWRTGGWRPAGRLLFDGGRVYLKTPERLACYDGAAIHDQPIWQSAWENRYELDSMSQQLAMFAMQMGGYLPQQGSSKPNTATEVLLFGDRVHQSMSIADGVVYSIEGRRVAGQIAAPNAARSFQWGTTPRRSRTNWLSAYQASGGKALWTRSASDEDKEGSSDVGFLAAPTPCGGILLAPVTDGGTIWLYGLDRATGKTLWKAYLCDEPQGGAPPWAEIAIAVDGREAYLSCGCGVVFAVDAALGNIRWAARYKRDGKSSMPQVRGPYGNIGSLLDVSGWDDDVVIPYGRLLVVMASDSDRLLALDRRTGERVWESPRVSPFGSAASYCLGVSGRGLFVADKNVIRRYDIPSGRLEQERAFEQSFGRGCLTEDAVYLPVKDSILKLSLDLKETLSHVGVALTSDEPVGNLFSDGEKLWVVGAGRVYAMTTLEHRLSMLGEQIAAGDAEAQLNRMRLYFKQNRNDLALADLRAAYERFQSQLAADAAAQRLFAVIAEQKLPQTQPLVTLALLTELFATSSSPQISREASARLRDLVAGSISAVRQQKPQEAVAALLAAAGLLGEEYIITAATFAIDASAGRDDIGRLIDAIERGSPPAQLVSIRAAVRLAPDDVKTPLAARLDAGDDRVRLAAARALANLGERDKVLETLLRLLESDIVQVRTRSHQTLQALTSQQIPFAPEGTPADRALAVKSWRQWIETSGSTAKLNLPLSERAILLERILLASPTGLIELDASRSERWRTRLSGSAWGCQGLPNGHRLVAINSHAMIVEYDDSGKEVWKKDRLPAPPTSVQRLESGNTLVACGNAQQIVEITPDGSTTTINVPGNPISAQRLDNGNTLVAIQQTQRVVEVDGYGRVVWEARTGGNPPWHAVRLENGNTLVTLTQARKVFEYDPTGKNVVWQTAVPLVNPTAAQRLPGGQTLVADHNGVHLIDATGKKIEWTHRLQGITGLSSF